jgi:hypothetical protein
MRIAMRSPMKRRWADWKARMAANEADRVMPRHRGYPIERVEPRQPRPIA